MLFMPVAVRAHITLSFPLGSCYVRSDQALEAQLSMCGCGCGQEEVDEVVVVSDDDDEEKGSGKGPARRSLMSLPKQQPREPQVLKEHNHKPKVGDAVSHQCHERYL
jgi:hypothetical protein